MIHVKEDIKTETENRKANRKDRTPQTKIPKPEQVQAPGLPDLTLIDLPGIVRTATKGQRSTVMAEVNGLIQR